MPGLETLAYEDRPSSEILFWSFRIMVGLGFADVRARPLEPARPLAEEALRLDLAAPAGALIMGPAGFVAVIAGWITTEVGRQPWVIYGLLRTRDAVSPIATPAVGASLIAFVIVYFTVFAAGALYILKLMRAAPHAGEGRARSTPRSAAPAPRPPPRSTRRGRRG